MIDLLIPGHSPGIKDTIVDLYGEPEILFFGPDEGTADMMDWAASKRSPEPSSSLAHHFDSSCPRTWRAMVEVVHDRQERGAAGRRAARRVRHDVAVRTPVRARHLQAARAAREGHHEGADGWSWYVYTGLALDKLVLI